MSKLNFNIVKKQISQKKWYSETAPGVFQYCLGFTNGYVNLYKWLHIRGHTIEILSIVDRLGVESSVADEREAVFESVRAKGAKDLRRLYNVWKNTVNTLVSLQNNLKVVGLTDQELHKLYQKVMQLDIEQWSFSIVSESSERFSNYELVPYLKRELKEELSTKELSDMAFYLCLEPRLSFMQLERIGFLEICRRIIMSDKPEGIRHLCESHSSKYYWITNNYQRAKVLTASQILSLAKKHAKDHADQIESELSELKCLIKAIEDKRKRHLKKKLCKKTRDLLDLLGLLGTINDERKEINLRTTDIYYRIFKEIERRKSADIDDLVYYLPDEIERLLLDNLAVGVRERKDCLLYAVTKDSEFFISGKKAKELTDFFGKTGTVNDLRGFVACNGDLDKFTGRVSVVRDPLKDRLRPGDVLVSTMTRPDFLPLMRKASAIVTDEGGITCHAAIISRELKIPCIVGVQAATKILTNGSLVELNLHHGLVRVVRS
ncbi:MAG: PEP-utilizing enzyme [archaeon]